MLKEDGNECIWFYDKRKPFVLNEMVNYFGHVSCGGIGTPLQHLEVNIIE